MRRLSILALLLLATAACGGDDSSNPAAPSAVAPVINGTTDMVYVGQRVTFTASGTDITWGGDNSAVATIDAATGAVTGTGTGRVTIWAQNAGGRATRMLRGLPSYNGSWSGSYSLTGCQSSGDWASNPFCVGFDEGQIMTIGFEITQSRDQVIGNVSLGTIQGPLSSSVVNEDGSLPLTGVITIGDVTIQLQTLRATSPSVGAMKGQFNQVWSISGVSGTGRLACDIRDVTRTSGAPTMTSFSHGANVPVLSLTQLMAAVARR